MAKRGETRPWKVEYKWPSGIKGKESFGSLELAELTAERLRRAADWRDEEVEIRVYCTEDSGRALPCDPPAYGSSRQSHPSAYRGLFQ